MYQSDLTDAQWEYIEPYLKRTDPRGAISKYSKRDIVNAIMYVLEGGIKWRMMPSNFPPWYTVYYHFKMLNTRGIWDQIMKDLVRISRLRQMRNPNPSYALIDAQSVKTQYRGDERGYDAGKKNKRKKAAYCD
jgi:putative transposase